MIFLFINFIKMVAEKFKKWAEKAENLSSIKGQLDGLKKEVKESGEKLDKHARELLFKAQDVKGIDYRDSKWDLIWIGAKKNGTTMEMTINKVEGSILKEVWDFFKLIVTGKPMPKKVVTQYTLRFGPKGYELITKEGEKPERSRKLTDEKEIAHVLRNFEVRLGEASREKENRKAEQRRRDNRLAETEPQNESVKGDQNPDASLEDIA